MMRVAQQHRNGEREHEHDECGRNVRGASHPYVHESIMFASDHVVDISATVLLLRQILKTVHQNVVVAKKVFQQKAAK